jgi:nitrogen fixation NifU-like protein
MEQYTDKVMDHFSNPRNVGEIKDADGVGEVGNLKCGDVMKISIKVGNKDGEEIISDIKFKTLGCAAAIASSSMTTEIARGKRLKDAENISKDDINEALGKLPAPKYHCSILAAEGIKKAIEDYKSKKAK